MTFGILPLKDADISLVDKKNNTYTCKIHGSMNKLTEDGIWRCVSTYRIENVKLIENSCKAGFQEGYILCLNCKTRVAKFHKAKDKPITDRKQMLPRKYGNFHAIDSTCGAFQNELDNKNLFSSFSCENETCLSILELNEVFIDMLNLKEGDNEYGY